MYCRCGCGEKTNLAPQTRKARNWIQGRPVHYVKGHENRGRYGGSNNPHYKGGRIIESGYVYLLVFDDHEFFNMAMCKSSSYYIAEHRLVMAQHLGRSLTRKEVVHHENEVKDDNRIENLRLFPSRSAHTRYHKGNWEKRRAAYQSS